MYQVPKAVPGTRVGTAVGTKAVIDAVEFECRRVSYYGLDKIRWQKFARKSAPQKNTAIKKNSRR